MLVGDQVRRTRLRRSSGHFNPQSPSTTTVVVLPSDAFYTLSCTSDQCTTLSYAGNAVTFSPTTGVVAHNLTLAYDSGGSPNFSGLSCPTDTQCTTLKVNGTHPGYEVTFTPVTGATTGTPFLVDTHANGSNMASDALTCVALTQCALGDESGYVAAFDPALTSASPASLVDTNGGGAAGVSCISAGAQCTEVDYNGGEVTFTATYNPGTVTAPTAVHSVDANGLDGVVCVSATACGGVDSDGYAVAFNPTTGAVTAGPTAIDVTAGYLSEVSCGSSTQCAAVDNENKVVTFNPASPQVATPVAVDPGGVAAIACPTGTQCTVVDYSGDEVTFNPAAPAATTPVAIDPGTELYSIACQSATQCTASDSNGAIVTFNPAAPGTPTPKPVVTNDAVYALSCPSTTQCTGSTETGGVVTSTRPRRRSARR